VARREVPLQRTDLPQFIGIICCGGMLGPVLMLVGLQRISGILGSLLLNLEAPLTILLALALFREHLGLRESIGAGLIVLGGIVLSVHPETGTADFLGIVAICGACFSWALDNNLTQHLSSLRDPLALTRMKALTAGVALLLLAIPFDQPWPPLLTSCTIMLLGLLSYGVSLVLDTYALRIIGAAREAAYFSTAPFIGALAAVPLLGEQWGTRDFLSAAIIVSGLVLLLGAHHRHQHAHEEVEHIHLHRLDAHHNHAHQDEGAVTEPHAHAHRHLALVHDHPHVSELHHRHSH
jgi:drug/metabolite transporter (DMT)-like permease